MADVQKDSNLGGNGHPWRIGPYQRLAKWQGITREQLSATSNLVLGLATGLLAFTTVLLIEQKLFVLCAFGWAVAAFVFLALSITLALLCTINRLKDFRLTAQIAHPKYRNSPQLKEMQDESIGLGERTWNLFRGQIWTFALGSASVGISIIIQVFSK